MTARVPETAVGQAVTAWLSSLGWECYPEAQFHTGGERADIVAVRGPLIWIVECKTSMSLQLLSQGHRWVGRAHYVSVASNSRSGRSAAAGVFCQYFGIGLFLTALGDASEIIRPRLNRIPPRVASKLRDRLHPDMKRYEPGSTAGSGYSTPWRRTMDDARSFITRHPGCTTKEIIDGIKHHYHTATSAVGSVRHWLARDESVRAEAAGRTFRWYPTRGEPCV